MIDTQVMRLTVPLEIAQTIKIEAIKEGITVREWLSLAIIRELSICGALPAVQETPTREVLYGRV